MSQNYFVQFYWFCRSEPVDVAADRLFRMLMYLREADVAFKEWDFWTERRGIQRLQTDSKVAIRTALLHGGNHRDIDNSVITELGFSLSLLSRHGFDRAVQVQCQIGCGSPLVSNTFWIGPLQSDDFEELTTFARMRSLARVVVHVMEPDFGVVTTKEYDASIYDYSDAAFKIEPRRPRIGWITYIADGYWTIPETIPCVGREHIPERGELLLATKRRFDASRPDDVERVDAIRRALFPE